MSATQVSVDILMATYNGEKYLSQQLDSILSQTFQDWRLLIRDDRSSDNTMMIVSEYAMRHPNKIMILPQGQHLGPKDSFSALLKQSQARYTMFSDQDDVWLPTKISRTLAVMLDLEKHLGTSFPLLVYSDLVVVDDELLTIDQSFFHYIGTRPLYTLKALLLQNTIAGCTVMINQSLGDMIPSIPDSAVMHDWWMGLVAAAFGKIVCLPESGILYRQHNNNTAGVKKRGFTNILTNHRSGAWRYAVTATQRQAAALGDLYGDHMHGNTRRMILDYANLYKNQFFVRKWIIMKYRLYRVGIMAALGWLLFI